MTPSPDDFPDGVLDDRIGKALVALASETALRQAAEAELGEARVQLARLQQDRSPARQAQIDSNRLVALIESSQDAIIGKTLDGRITDWNGAAQTLFGYTAEEALGMSVLMLIPEAVKPVVA